MIEIPEFSIEDKENEVISETKASLRVLKHEITEKNSQENLPPFSRNIYDKPIQLGYNKIHKEKDISINFPDQFSVEGRLLRCMRWKPITDAIEKKYDIPKGLLLAMMAQEGMGDPLMPNLSGDGGLGLIHIQAINAAKFGLHTLPRYTEGPRDLKHGEEIIAAKKAYKDNLKDLINVDDRFHPIMGLDCSARFLKNVYNSTQAGKDRRINALRKYSGRALNDYLRPVVKYWILINTYTGDSFPKFTKNTQHEITKMKEQGFIMVNSQKVHLDTLKNASKKLTININGKPASYKDYLTYFTEQADNYGLQDYINIPTLPPNISYLHKSKDKQWNIYQYTLLADTTLSQTGDSLAHTELQKIFPRKTLEITDKNGFPLGDPLNFPHKQGDIFYIKEKIEN